MTACITFSLNEDFTFNAMKFKREDLRKEHQLMLHSESHGAVEMLRAELSGRVQAGGQHQHRDVQADQKSFEKDWAAYGKDQEGGWAMAEGSEDPTKARRPDSSVPIEDQVDAPSCCMLMICDGISSTACSRHSFYLLKACHMGVNETRRQQQKFAGIQRSYTDAAACKPSSEDVKTNLCWLQRAKQKIQDLETAIEERERRLNRVGQSVAQVLPLSSCICPGSCIPLYSLRASASGL